MQVVILILGGVILTVLAVNGTFKNLSHAVDEGGQALVEGAGAVKNLFNPVTLIILLVLALVLLPLFRKGG